jgi:hypothetical protein
MNLEEMSKIVEKAAADLGEHFEAVEILVCNSDGNGVECIKRGAGNYYARLQMAQEFIDEDKAVTWHRTVQREKED